MAARGLNFDVSPVTLAVAGVAAFAFYVYTFEQGEELLDDIVINPLDRAADAGGTGVRAVYRDWVKPFSPKSIGKNVERFGKWLT